MRRGTETEKAPRRVKTRQFRRHTHVLGLVRRDEARHHLDEGLLDLEMVVLGVAPLRRVSATARRDNATEMSAEEDARFRGPLT
jgi:hypothetical protein